MKHGQANFYYSPTQGGRGNQVYLNGKWVYYTEMQDVETSKGSSFKDAVYLGTTEYWFIKVDGVIQSEKLRNYLEVKDTLEQENGITICGGIPAGGMYDLLSDSLKRDNGSLCVVGLEESTKEAVKSMQRAGESFKHINVGTIGHVDHGKTSLTTAINNTLRFYDDLYKEDETISCKDSASGVKCVKVKKGGNHFKPFYQTSRY